MHVREYIGWVCVSVKVCKSVCACVFTLACVGRHICVRVWVRMHVTVGANEQGGRGIGKSEDKEQLVHAGGMLAVREYAWVRLCLYALPKVSEPPWRLCALPKAGKALWRLCALPKVSEPLGACVRSQKKARPSGACVRSQEQARALSAAPCGSRRSIGCAACFKWPLVRLVHASTHAAIP